MTKILLVEDDKSLREIYGVRLLAEGYDIVSAGDGEEALAMAIKERPQLIVSDVMMPKISGFDMLDILRSTSETKEIKVIMMTALSSEDQRARGEALGADRYLVKSQVGIEDVVRTVHDVLGDSLAPAPTAAQTFGTPGPSAIARPPVAVAPRPDTPVVAAPPVIPTPAVVPIVTSPQPVVLGPVASPASTPQPISTPVINSPSVAPVAPVSPFQTPPAANPLPQPTAPFSSNRPGSLGDRIIHPLTDQPAPIDVGDLMAQELSSVQAPPVAPPVLQIPTPPPAPVVPPMPSVDPIAPIEPAPAPQSF
jgi:CheY-like chemotaxis protein